MAAFITSADAIFVLTIDTLFNAPITLENWSADRAWESQSFVQAETRMSIDAHFNVGYVPNPVDMTLTLQPNSNSVAAFELLQTSQAVNMTPYQLGAEISLPGLKRKYTLTNGFLTGGSMLPSAGRLLEERSFTLQWGRVIGLGI